MRREWRVTW